MQFLATMCQWQLKGCNAKERRGEQIWGDIQQAPLTPKDVELAVFPKERGSVYTDSEPKPQNQTSKVLNLGPTL